MNSQDKFFLNETVKFVATQLDLQSLPRKIVIVNNVSFTEENLSFGVYNTETNEIETVNYFEVAEEKLVERTFLFIFKRKNIINKGRINSKFIPYTDPKMYVSNIFIGNGQFMKLNFA